MRRYRLVLRLMTIQRVLIKHGLDEFVWATHLLRPVGWLRRLMPRRQKNVSQGIESIRSRGVVGSPKLTKHKPN